jgi:CHASE2 domain-containing sensor protein
MILEAQPTETEIIKAEVEMLSKMINEVLSNIKQAQANLIKMHIVRDRLLKSIENEDEQLVFDFNEPDAVQTAE